MSHVVHLQCGLWHRSTIHANRLATIGSDVLPPAFFYDIYCDGDQWKKWSGLVPFTEVLEIGSILIDGGGEEEDTHGF